MKKRHGVISGAMVILERGGKIFMIKRKNTGWKDGSYDLIAGHLEMGEKLKDTAIREAREEAGITIHKEDLELAHVISLKRSDGDGVYGYFRARQWEGEPHAAEPEKSDGYKWLSLEDIKKEQILEIVRDVLVHIKNGEIYSEGVYL